MSRNYNRKPVSVYNIIHFKIPEKLLIEERVVRDDWIE